MNEVFDNRQIRRAFSRSAQGYEAAAALQREVESRLLESLDYLEDRQAHTIVDLGCGPGHPSAAMRKRWPKARVIALDLALPMLREARKQSGWWRPFDRV